MPNHAGPSGYDRLAEFIEGEILLPIVRWKRHQRVMARCLGRLVERSGLQWYHRDSLFQELAAARRWLGGGKRIFHFLYGENSYRYLGLMKPAAHRRIVCTYHTPPDKFNTVVRFREHLKRIDLAVVVSTVQQDFLADMIGPERVVYIPHGVDTDYFTPPRRPRAVSKRIRCLFVGTHLRDFETLADAAAHMNRKGAPFSLTVVTAPTHHRLFEGIDNVRFLSGVSDAALLGLYRESDLLLFPLLAATANNTLLEAMACGLPIVTTDDAGIRDYITEACAVLTPRKSPEALVEAVMDLQTARGRLDRMAEAGRRRALEFSWPRIAEKVVEHYAAF